MNNSKTREEIIDSMCLTHSHDFWLDKTADNPFCGMDEKEREGLRTTMRQIFDNDIYPQLKLLVLDVFIDALKEVALKYDEKWGTYPESQFEGLEIFGFALEYFGLDQSAMNEFVDKNKELYGS